MLIITTVSVPFIGAIINTVIPNKSVKKQWVNSIVFSVVAFILSIVLWLNYDSNATVSIYQFTRESDYADVTFGNIHIGLDGISLYFFILTTLITPICLLSGRYSIGKDVTGYISIFLLLEGLLCLVFTVQDLLLFYVFFESVLIPLFLLIGLYGSGVMKIRASYLLFLYTLFGSLFMLLSFMVIYYYTGTTNIQALSFYDMNFKAQLAVFVGIILSMAIKTPLVPFNTWLTYAHSEAPVGGSIILAGVILKLATYGYIRIMLQRLPDASDYFTPLIIMFASLSVVYGSLSTIRQTDFKKLVAYSSVAHIGVVVIGVFSNTLEGIEGAILLSIAHGLVSPALFFLVGGVIYDRFHTRYIKYYRGLVLYMPLFSVIMFIFSISNAAVPLTANWLGEFMILTGVIQRNIVGAVLASTGIVLSVIYSVWLFARMCFGTYSPYLGATIDLTRREIAILLPLLVFTVLFGIMPNVVLVDLHTAISSILYNNSPLLDLL